MSLVTRNLDWNKPALPQIIEELQDLGRVEETILDLRAVQVVVTTRQTGRILHQRLARAVGAANRVLFPPQWVLPEALLVAEDGLAVAGAREALLGWVSVLLRLEPGRFASLFGSRERPDNTEQALPWARLLWEAQELLGENHLSFARVSERGDLPSGEVSRWKELAALEAIFQQELEARGQISPLQARLHQLENPKWDSTLKTLVLVLPGDPQPAVIRFLQALLEQEDSPDIRVLTWGPDQSGAFDAWGRPQAAFWLQENPPNPQLAGRLHPTRNVREESLQVARLLEPNLKTPGAVSVGIQEGEVVPGLQRHVPVFDPAGESLQTTWVFALLSRVKSWLETRSFRDCIQLLHTPLVRERLARDRDAFHLENVLAEADRIQAQMLPDTQADARRGLAEDSPLEPVLRRLDHWRQALERKPFEQGLLEWLDELAEGASLEGRQASVWRRWAELLPEVAGCVAEYPMESAAGFLSLVLELMAEETYYPEIPEAGLRLQGWLELPLVEAPHLVLSEVADEYLPGSRKSHLLLPDSLRADLGIRNEGTRFVRDAWLLSCLDVSRRAGGRLDFTVSRTSSGGEPRKPSRLLFLGPAGQQPARVHQAFREPPALEGEPSWSLGFPLVPPAPQRRIPGWSKVSVTAFRDYLQCPFRFYLKHGLGMEAYPADKLEWDAGEFGTWAHQALEWFARDPELSRSEDAGKIAGALADYLERRVRGRYGRDLPLPLEIQLDSLHQRLRAWAELEAQSRQEGWEIQPEGIEWKPPKDDQRYGLEGIRISGMIDRIERHRETGVLRILDFKTREKRTDPFRAHLIPWKEDRDAEIIEAFARLSHGGKDYHWKDLQLPLYAWMVQLKNPDQELEVGYVHLPKAVGETGVELWPGLAGSGLVQSALECAGSILQRLSRGQFWPPREKVDFDDFESFIFESVQQDVDGRYLQGELS